MITKCSTEDHWRCGTA